jgi:AcrR family transcriptional regulator
MNLFSETAVMTRDEQKKRTREKVVAAARLLFREPGFEKTTIRMIADVAGVAVGSVFTTFETKDEVLVAVMEENYGEIGAAITKGLSTPGPIADRIAAAFEQAFQLDFLRLDLVLHMIGASLTWTRAFELKNRASLGQAFSGIGAALAQADAVGELAPGTDRFALEHLLLGIYLRTFRHAWYNGLDASGASAFAKNQVRMVFYGVSALPAPRP